MIYYFAVGLVVAAIVMVHEHDGTLGAWDEAGVLLAVGIVSLIAWPVIVLRFIVKRGE